MGHAAARHSAAQHRSDVVLGQQIGESFGAVSAGEGDHISGAKEKCLRHPEATPDIA
jgi:hypothetical protein